VIPVRLRRFLPGAALIALLSLVLLYPIWLTVRGGFEGADGSFTLYHVAQVAADPVLRDGLLNALGIALFTTLASLAIAIPLALLRVRCEFPGARLLGALLLAPLILPPFVGAVGVHQVLGLRGALNSLLLELGLIGRPIDFLGRGGFWAVVAVEALHLYPIVYLNLAAALRTLDPALEEAAANLGASRLRRLLGIVAPLVRPGLFAGCTVVFIWSLTEMGTPIIFDYERVTPVQIFYGINAMAASKQPWALTAVMLAAAAGAYVLGRLVFGRAVPAMLQRGASAAVPRRLGRREGLLAQALFAGVVAVAVLPHLAVILTSVSRVGAWYGTVLPEQFTLEHYVTAVNHPLAVGSVRNSLLFASAATVLDLVLGLLIAYAVVRTTLPGRRIVDALSMLPLAVPGLVMAFGYTAMTLRWPFGPGGPLAGTIDVIGPQPNPVPLLILAYAVRRLPYVVRAAAAGLEQTPIALEEAARNLGAGRIRSVLTIAVPLIAASLLAGGIMAFSFAMLEVSDSLILAQREAHFPITKAIYVLFERLGDGRAVASAMGVWAMALLAVTLAGAALLLGRRLGGMFRA
jgi:iron(III) transport system permease protein